MKRLWPAALALVMLLVVWLAMRGHGGDDAAAPPPVHAATAEPGAPHEAPAMPSQPPPGVAIPAATSTGSDDADDHRGSGPIVGTPSVAENPPDMTPKKGKMTLDEKLAETAKHIEVMKKRTELLQTEIDQLDKAGKTKEAQEQRIVLERLQKHMKELQTAIDEHKEPM